MKDLIKSYLPGKDYIFGFADLKGLLAPKYSEFKYGLCIGKHLDDRIVDELINGPTLEYFHHYNDVNKHLDELSKKISAELKKNNINSVPVVPTIAIGSPENKKYLQSLSYDISHKMVATRAGLGWIGKTGLFISREFGPRLRLVTILLEQDPGCPGKPVEKSQCGTCEICVAKCPAKAASGLKWNVAIHRDQFFDAHKCREKCGELARQKLNVDERICGICVSVCPIGRIG